MKVEETTNNYNLISLSHKKYKLLEELEKTNPMGDWIKNYQKTLPEELGYILVDNENNYELCWNYDEYDLLENASIVHLLKNLEDVSIPYLTKLLKNCKQNNFG